LPPGRFRAQARCHPTQPERTDLILVDTSIWIDYLRGTSRELTTHLEAGQVAIHPWVIGELACGTLENRQTVLSLLGTMPTVVMADHQDMLTLIDTHQPIGRGIDYVDAHLMPQPC